MIKEKIYWIENAISNAQNVVHVWIWAGAFQKRNILGGHFLEVVLDFHFIGAALLKAASLTVMITFSVTQFNLHYHCPLTLPPPPPIKWKPSRTLTTTSKRLPTSALLNRKRYFQGRKCGSRLGWHLSRKEILGTIFWKWCWISIL